MFAFYEYDIFCAFLIISSVIPLLEFLVLGVLGPISTPTPDMNRTVLRLSEPYSHTAMMYLIHSQYHEKWVQIFGCY
jgi:hypothetical protein